MAGLLLLPKLLFAGEGEILSVDHFPSQTCWGDHFDIVITGLTGDLVSDCYDDSLMWLRFIIWEEDGGWIDPDDNVREDWKLFEVGGLTYGVPYGDTLKDVHLAGWCDEYDYTGEFLLEVYGPCLTSTYRTSKEEVSLIFYPSAPSTTAPTANDTIPSNAVLLQWNGIRNANYYQVQVDKDNSFTTPVVDDQTGAISFQLANLDEGVSYYWRVRAGNNTCGDGNWSATKLFTAGTPTGVDGPTEPSLPTEFALLQNHPNPFNACTTIEFALPIACHVTLDIYNLTGQKVKTLLDTRMASGHKSVVWDGTNDDGEAVASGVYLYKMSAGNELASRKMLLLK
jgi:hypothetical protein